MNVGERTLFRCACSGRRTFHWTERGSGSVTLCGLGVKRHRPDPDATECEACRTLASDALAPLSEPPTSVTIANEQARKWLGKIIDTDRANCDLYPEHRLRLLDAVIHEADMAIGHSVFARACRPSGAGAPANDHGAEGSDER